MIEISNIGNASIDARNVVAPAVDKEAQARSEIVAKIHSEIERLRVGSQSPDIEELIRELQGLAGSANLLSPAALSAQLHRLSVRADKEIAERVSEAGLETMRAGIISDELETRYGQLSEARRQRIINTEALWTGAWTAENKIKIIQNLYMSDDFGDPAFSRRMSEKALGVEGMEEDMAAMRNASPAARRAVMIEKEDFEQRRDRAIASAKDPKLKHELKCIGTMCSKDDDGAKKIEQALENPSDAHKILQEVKRDFMGNVNKHYDKILATVSPEAKKHIVEMGGVEGATKRVMELMGDEKRLAAVKRFNEGHREGASEDTKKDAAAQEFFAIASTRVTAYIMKQKVKEYEALLAAKAEIPENLKELVAQDTKPERRAELLGQELNAQAHGKFPPDALKKISEDTVKKMMEAYPDDIRKIKDANREQMSAISKAAAYDTISYAATAMKENFFNTNKDEQEVISRTTGKKVAKQLEDVLGHKTSIAVGDSVASVMRAGADLKDIAVHAAHGDLEKAGANLASLAQRGMRQTSTLIDGATSLFHISTLSNEVRSKMDSYNKTELGWTNITNSLGQRIFDKDESGKISLDEMKSMLAKHGYKDLSALDKNGDDKLSYGELNAALNKIVKKERAAADAKFDKMLDKFEEKGWAELKDKKTGKKLFDTNGDGKLDHAEVLAVLKKEGIDLSKLDKNKNGVDVADLNQAFNQVVQNHKQPAAKGKAREA